MSELENTIKYLSKSFKKNNRLLLLAAIVIAVISLFNKVPEVGSVLIASYLIALIIEPWILNLERFKLSRSSAVISILFFSMAIFTGFMLLVMPNIIEQIIHLIEKLPGNLELLRTKALEYCRTKPAENTFIRQAVSWSLERADFSNIDSQHFTTAFKTVSNALMGGYSVALALLNLFLMPFFIFYLSRDLKDFHLSMEKFFPELRNKTFVEVSSEIVSRIRSFFKGQLTVCLILAGLYSFGLTIVGLPSAFGIGVLTGLFNIFPYLGFVFGLVTSTILVFSSDYGFSLLIKVYLVFIIIQVLEGNFITPKIVSDSVGVHPLVVMISIIIGGQLFGLIGLLIAIPTAAIIGVILNRALT